MAAGSRCADRIGQDGRRDPRVGGAPAAEPRRHAPPSGLVPAHADARRADRGRGQRLVRQAGRRSGRREPTPAARGRARAHGRRGRWRLAGDAGAPGGARRHPGHAAEPCPDARIRVVPCSLADGVRPPARGRAVGVRRGAAHGRGPGDLRAARGVSSGGRGSSAARGPSGGHSFPQPLDLGDPGPAVARHRGSSGAGSRIGRQGRSDRGARRQARTSGARGQETDSFAGGSGIAEESPTSPTTSGGSQTPSGTHTAPAR